MPLTIIGSAPDALIVRTSQDPGTIANALRQEVWGTDSGVALVNPGTLNDFISEQLYTAPRFGFLVMAILGGIGLILVTVGVYSVLAYIGHAEDARNWHSHGPGSRTFRRSQNGRQGGAATCSGRRSRRDRSKSRTGAIHRDATRGHDGLRSRDAFRDDGAADDDGGHRLLDSGAARGTSRSVGRTALRIAARGRKGKLGAHCRRD